MTMFLVSLAGFLAMLREHARNGWAILPCHFSCPASFMFYAFGWGLTIASGAATVAAAVMMMV